MRSRPAAQPLSVACHRQSSRYPALSMWLISRRNRPSWIFSARVASMTSMVKRAEAVGDVSLDEPVRSLPGRLPPR